MRSNARAYTAPDREGVITAAFTVDLPREPRSIIVDDDGRRAFIAHVVGARMSAVSLDESEHPVHVIDLRVGSTTGRLAHDVKSGDVIEASLRFDTPSLRFVSETAPYFHDGRSRSLEEVMEHSDGSMGHTMHLSRPDLLALVADLETL